MDTLDATQPLPNQFILNSAETYLYEIGLCLTCDNTTKRTKLHNPLLIFIITIISITKILISLLLDEENKYYFIIIGDFFYLLGIRIHYNIAATIYMLLSLSSQWIYYYIYKNGVKPNYLKVFEMMSGLVSPKSIGLTDKKQIYKLLKLSKYLFFICKPITQKLIPISILTTIMIIFFMKCSITETVIFGIPNSLLFTLCSYYMNNINIWQSIYFYITCYYIKIKLKQSNEQISKIKTNRGHKSIAANIRSLNLLYSEINEYNDSFWSKYLLIVWIFYGSGIVLGLYGLLFVEMNIFVKTIISCFVIFLFLIFIMIINTASSVNYEANKIYKILNQMIASQSKSHWRKVLRLNYYNEISSQIKVSLRIEIILIFKK